MSKKEKTSHLRPFRVMGTFLDNEQNPSLHESDVVVLGIAFDATASYNKGAWFGPDAIMAASHQIEFEAPVFGVSLTQKVKIHSLGLLEYPRQFESGSWVEWSENELKERCNEMVFETKKIASSVLKEKKVLVSFGGEHSTANGLFQAIAENYNPNEVTLVHLDAHLDLRNALEDLEYSHGSVIRRGLDLGFPSVHIGIRDHISEEEASFIREKGLAKRIFPCPTMPLPFYQAGTGVFVEQNFLWNGLFSLEVMDRIFSLIQTPFVYFSIDVDAFDPTVFPGTGTPLPFGLDFASTQDFLFRLLRRCKEKKIQILGFDIQEVAPQMGKRVVEYDALQTSSTITEMNAALLVYKLLLWYFLDRFKK